MGNCKTCFYWYKILDNNDVWHSPYGECHLVNEHSIDTPAWLAALPSLPSDVDVDILLISKPNFGCNQYRPERQPKKARTVLGFSLLVTGLCIVIGTRLYHIIVYPGLTEAQALIFFLPLWLVAIGIALAGLVIVKKYN